MTVASTTPYLPDARDIHEPVRKVYAIFSTGSDR